MNSVQIPSECILNADITTLCASVARGGNMGPFSLSDSTKKHQAASGLNRLYQVQIAGAIPTPRSPLQASYLAPSLPLISILVGAGLGRLESEGNLLRLPDMDSPAPLLLSARPQPN